MSGGWRNKDNILYLRQNLVSGLKSTQIYIYIYEVGQSVYFQLGSKIYQAKLGFHASLYIYHEGHFFKIHPQPHPVLVLSQFDLICAFFVSSLSDTLPLPILFIRYTSTPYPLYPIHLHSLSSLSDTPSLPFLFIRCTPYSLYFLSDTPPLPILFIRYTSTPSPLYTIHPHSVSSLSDTPPLPILFIRYTPTHFPLYSRHPNSLSSLYDTPPLPLFFIRYTPTLCPFYTIRLPSLLFIRFFVSHKNIEEFF